MNLLTRDEYFTFWEESGVICLKYQQKNITLDIARIGVSTRTSLTNYKTCRLFADMSNVKSITKEARDYYATYEAGKLVEACAVYTPSLLTKTLFAFFVSFNKPALPIKSFTNKKKAFKWLKDYGRDISKT
jgi:hypothetical protein